MNTFRDQFNKLISLKRNQNSNNIGTSEPLGNEATGNYQPLIDFESERTSLCSQEASSLPPLTSTSNLIESGEQITAQQGPMMSSHHVNRNSGTFEDSSQSALIQNENNSSAESAPPQVLTVINGSRSRSTTNNNNSSSSLRVSLNEYRQHLREATSSRSSNAAIGNAASAHRAAPARASFLNNFLFPAATAQRQMNRRHRSHRNHHRSSGGISSHRSRSSRRQNTNTTLNQLNILSDYHSNRNQAPGCTGGVVTLPASCNYALNLTPSTATSSSSSSSTSNSNNGSSSACFSLINMVGGKQSERNLLSSCCAVFCIAILAVSLVETRWFYLNGGGCNLKYLGASQFFSPGQLVYHTEMSKVAKTEILVFNFISSNGLVLKNCTNREILLIMRTIIAFVFLAIFSSCIALILDSIGCMTSGIKVVRRHGIFHILTVLLCLTINGFCFWISERIYDQQSETRSKSGKKIDVSFDVSYYLIVLASSLSILATAFTLIKRYPSDEDDQLERLIEEYTGFEEPVHLERSLPAVPHAQLAQQQQQSMLHSSSSNCAHHPSYHGNSNTHEHEHEQLLGPTDAQNPESSGNQHHQQHNTNDLYVYANSNDLMQYNSQQQQQQQQQQQPERLSTLSRLSLHPMTMADQQSRQQLPPPPPLTPPPSLHSSSIQHLASSNSQQAQYQQLRPLVVASTATDTTSDNNLNWRQSNESLLDPPPPYDPTPVIA